MTYVKKKHMTKQGPEPKTYRRLGKYSDHLDLAIGSHGKLANSIYTPG